MKFNGVHIGGRETGPVSIRTEGDHDLAMQYVDYGRKCLGELKRRIQLSPMAYKVGQATWKIENDPKIEITVKSNMIGLADIDEIFIKADVKAQPINRCVGYIIQGFIDSPRLITDEWGDTYYDTDESFVEFAVTVPGEVTGNKTIEYQGDLPSFPFYPETDFSGFPNYNTKLAPIINHSREEYVLVYSLAISINYTGKGPVVWVPNEAAGSHPLPSMPSEWTWVTDNAYASGVCDPGGAWEERPEFLSQPPESPTPQTPKVTWANPDGTTGSSAGTNILDYHPFWTGGHHAPYYPLYDFCFRDGPTCWGSSQAELDAFTGAMGANRISQAANIISPTNAACASNYSAWMSEVYYDRTTSKYYLPYATWEGHQYTYPLRIVKSNDDNGFSINHGFDITNGVKLTGCSTEYGAGALFMMPYLGENIFYYSQDILNRNETITSYSSQLTNVGIASGYAVDQWGWHVEVSTVADTTNQYNVDRNSEYKYDMQDKFGIKNKVRQGVHVINVRRFVESYYKINLKVHLFMSDGGKTVVSINDVEIPEGQKEWNKELRIDVRELKANESPSNLVTVNERASA